MENIKTETVVNPQWWNAKHDSSWDRVKEALARDWEQTKADFSKRDGHELNQNVSDTVKQAAGKEPIPPPNKPNTKIEYRYLEPAVRYGHGAAVRYDTYPTWSQKLEEELKIEWEGLKSGRDWELVKQEVRRGWDSVRGHKH